VWSSSGFLIKTPTEFLIENERVSELKYMQLL